MTITILVIDDSADDQHLYQRAFKTFDDFSLVMASSAAEGFARIADTSSNSKRPDLILLDYNLPDMDGLSFMKKLAESSDTPIPIIMLTGEGNAAIAVEAMKNGVDDYIIKDTDGRYLRLLPGVAGHVMVAHTQREQAMLLWREKESLLLRNQVLMQNATDGIHVMDMRGNLVEANDAFCRMLGYSREEALRLNVADWDAQSSVEELRARFKDHIINNARFETVHRRKDGTLIDVEISTSGIEFEEQYLIFATSHDITERKSTERVLLRNQILMQNSMDGIHVLDLQGNLVEANDAFCRMLGYTHEETLHLNVTDWASKFSGEELRSRLKDHIGKSFILETLHRRKDGALINVEISITGKVIDGQGLVFCSSRNISERKLAEEKLKLSAQLLNSTSDSVFLFDLEGNFVYLNEAAWQSRGYTLNEMMAMKLSDLNTPEFRKFIAPRIKEMLENGHGFYESAHYCKDGSVMPVEINSRIIESGGRKLFLATIRDITERKTSEAVLKQHNQVIDTSIDGFWMTDMKGNVLEANQAYAAMSGYSVEELVGMHISQLEALEQSPQVVLAHIALIIAEGNDRFETRHRRRDGSEIDIEISVTYLLDSQQLAVFCRDITERKRSEEALRVAAVTFETHDAIVITDANANIIQVNRAFSDITGYSPEEVLGKNPRIMSSRCHDRHFYQKMWQQLLHTGTWSGEIWDKRKNGEIYPKWMTITAIKNELQETVQYIAISSDITARVEAEEELLRESDERFRGTLEQAAVGIAHAALDGAYIQINKKFCEILGYTSTELIQLGFEEVTFPEDLDKDSVFIGQILAGEISTFAVEKRYVRKNRSLVWMNLTVSLLHNSDGSPKCFIFVVEDITERKRVEIELRESRQLLRELAAQAETSLEKERKHIAREIHDELGQLLTALRMDVALLRIHSGGQDAALLEKTQSMTALLDQAIQGVRNVATNLRPTVMDMGIVAAIEWLRDEFVKHTGFPCALHLPEEGNGLDERLSMIVFRIVQESLTNVARHAEANRVTISMVCDDDMLHVSVHDNGKGFDPANIEHRKSFGLLGMNERAIALGGSFEIFSSPQLGTTVSILLPIKPKEDI